MLNIYSISTVPENSVPSSSAPSVTTGISALRSACRTITVHSRRRNGEGMMTVLGRYADRLVRTPEGWRIAGITFTRYE